LESLEELRIFAELLLESTEELDEDFVDEELPVFFSLDDDFAELLLNTLVSLSLDFGVTLEELLDFAFELLEQSQSSQADEESPLGRVAKSLLSSSPQATSTAATNPAIKNFFKDINYTPAK
jgi:hypothetical protein